LPDAGVVGVVGRCHVQWGGGAGGAVPSPPAPSVAVERHLNNVGGTSLLNAFVPPTAPP